MSGRLLAGLLAGALCALVAANGPAGAGEPKPDPRARATDSRSFAAQVRQRALAAPRQKIDQRRRSFVSTSTVNDPSADTTVRNTQNTTALLDLGGGKLVAAFSDTGSLGASSDHFMGYAYSSDGGVSWTDAGKLPDSAFGDIGPGALAQHKASGTVHLLALGLTTANATPIFRSTDDGHTFQAPVNATPGLDIDEIVGRASIAVDNFGDAESGNGMIYVCAYVFNTTTGTSRLVVTRSSDGGNTFGPSGGALISLGGVGCQMAIGPDHSVYATYLRGTGFDGVGGDNALYIRKSTDGGSSFSSQGIIADLATTSPYGELGADSLATFSFPQVAINPAAGRPFLYVAYNDIDPLDPDRGSQIYYVRSTDGGGAWSSPIRVNDDGPGDQVFPSLGFANAGNTLLVSYYSRSQIPGDTAFHRRARMGRVSSGGGVNFTASFQLGPNAPISTSDDNIADQSYIGEFDGVAGGDGVISLTWADARAGDATSTNQYDVQFAQIVVPPVDADLSVAISPSTATATRGDSVTFTVDVSAMGGDARDVFVNLPTRKGVLLQNAAGDALSCTTSALGAGCLIGTVLAGETKSIFVTGPVGGAAQVVQTVTATTSSADRQPANNKASTTVTVSSTGVKSSHRTMVNLPIPDLGVVEVPLNVPVTGTVVDVTARVRLDHTFDGDLQISLIAPNGVTTVLANRRGEAGENYGSGTNDCYGTVTSFSDSAARPISEGTAPFEGAYRPETALLAITGSASDGLWKLRIEDLAAQDTGVVSCFALLVTRTP